MILLVSCFGRHEQVEDATAARRRRRIIRDIEDNLSDSEYEYSDSDEENPITLTEKDYDIFFPLISLKKKKIKLFDESCSICIDELKNGSTVRQILTCKHAYHSSCLLDWVKINESCPNCKEDLHKDHMIEKLKKENPKKIKELLKKGIDFSDSLEGESPSAGLRRRRRAQRPRLQMRREAPPPLPQSIVRRIRSVNQNQNGRRSSRRRENNTEDLDSSIAMLNREPRDLTDSELMFVMQMREIDMWERQGRGGDMIPVQMV